MTITALEEAKRFVSVVYRVILRREVDPPALKNYVEALQAGRSPVSIIEEFENCDEFKAQNAVKLFVPPGHYYSPIVNPIEAEKHLTKLAASGTPSALQRIVLDRDEMIKKWHSLLPFMKSNPFPETKGSKYRYAFDNPSYSWGDGSSLHAMLRYHRPKRVIEIGSGWSSACMVDTIEHYLNGACSLTFVEPYPALVRELIGKFAKQAQFFEKPVQDVPLDIFEELEAGDIVFIDSIHILRTGSDVCFELFEILPRLPKGVLVHFHDMFWPFEYPWEWAVDENRSWNELYAVRALLTDNARWRIIFFNDYLAKIERSMLEATFPEFLHNSGGALWLERT